MRKPADDEGITIVFLCQCGTNISDNLDLDAIRSWIKGSGKVQMTVRGGLLCSPREKEILSRLLNGNNQYIHNRKIKSIVVAACSPKQHENTFREIAEKNNINLARVQMANIREHCAWVTKDKELATAKAIRIIDAALERSRFTRELGRPTMQVLTDVVIIGGGITGIQAALTLSRAGRKVHLVEKEISLGGAVIKTEEVAPFMECSPCLLAPLLSKVRDDSNINVITNAYVEEVVGFFGNFAVTVRKKARFVEESCIGCEECFEECPVSVEHAFHYNLGQRKAIYGLFTGSVPAAVAIDRENCSHFIDDTCDVCQTICPFQAVNFEQQDELLKIQAGSILVATGFSNGRTETLEHLGYGKLDNVFTTFEFERLVSSNGPTGSKVVLAGDKTPASAAVIHCAGSLTADGIPYCSGVCCSNAIKVGELLRSSHPDIKVYNIHNDLVLSHPADYQFFEKQKEQGTHFIKCIDLSSLGVSRLESDDKIHITGDNMSPLDVDLLILSTGLLPAAGTGDLAKLLNVDLDENGFYKPDHGLLHNTGTVLDGIYIAGCAASPRGVSSSINQAHAVAGDILSKLIPGQELELEIITSFIDADKCAGCKLCLSVCPFKAVYFDNENKVSVINEAVCRGCGTCTAACPSGASTARHFSQEQINAEIGGLLNE